MPSDKTQSILWIGRAAHLGDPAAQYTLGIACQRTSLDPSQENASESRIEAYKWFQLAAAQGYQGSDAARASLTHKMTREDVAEGNKRAAGLKFEETQPYGVWLQARLDCLDVAEALRKEVTPKAGDANRLPAPSPQRQRAVWVKVLEARPAPPGATEQVSRLKKIFAAEGVPPALVWVAEVESSFDSRARSPAGAAGLFQLMPVTARSLGLSVILPDERLHAEKSARAAARYLRHLYARFGDWRLALAAYNAGETRVETLRKGGAPGTFDAIAHRLPVETQMFVPKVEATLRRREGINLLELGPPKA